jgi:hypothetical protein
MDQELESLIKNVDTALWKLQEYFNSQPKEEIPGYIGTCQNRGALYTYQLRVEFGFKFPHFQILKIGN